MDSNRKNIAKMDFLFPRLRLETLCDVLLLNGCKICWRPEDADIILRWYDIFQDGTTCPYEINPLKLLHVRRPEDAKQVLEDCAACVVMTITQDEVFPYELEDHRDRVIHVCSPEGFGKAQVTIERVFMELLVWENRLNFAVASGSPLDDLLDAGASVLNNFLFAITLDGDVIAYSHDIEAPSGMLSKLVEHKRVPEPLRVLVAPQSTSSNSKTQDAETLFIGGVPCVRIPLKVRSISFGYLVMVAASTELTLGYKFAFMNFSRYVESSVNTWMLDTVTSKVPHVFSLESLVSGHRVDDCSLESIMADLGIGETATFKLVVARLSECAMCGIGNAMSAMRRLHGGRCFVLPYKEYLVGLCYSELGPVMLSHERTEADLERLMFKPYRIVCSLSQVYSDIRDTKYAFKQAEFVMEQRESIENEMIVVERSANKCALCFEMVFGYWLMSSASCDRKAMDFAFSSNLPEAIMEADLRDGTSDFALLWYYLEGERNASYVSKRMYMHRNTVSYRIKQLEKHFEFSLDHHFYREKLMLEYRRYFNTLGPEKLKHLFEIHSEGN